VEGNKRRSSADQLLGFTANKHPIKNSLLPRTTVTGLLCLCEVYGYLSEFYEKRREHKTFVIAKTSPLRLNRIYNHQKIANVGLDTRARERMEGLLHCRSRPSLFRHSTMSKMSKLAIVVAIAASIATPVFAQIADTPYAPPLNNYYPAGIGVAPGIRVAPPYSNFPAATGGGSYGYNVGVLRDGG
jgi:hypothetical protein